MTIPSWPSDLSAILEVNAFGTSFRDGRLSTKMDRGPAKMRRLSSASIKPIVGQIKGSFDDCARLERFWDEDLSGGVLPFMFPSPLKDGVTLAHSSGVALLDPDGEAILVTRWDLVLFAADGAPQISAASDDLFTMQFKLSVMP